MHVPKCLKPVAAGALIVVNKDYWRIQKLSIVQSGIPSYYKALRLSRQVVHSHIFEARTAIIKDNPRRLFDVIVNYQNMNIDFGIREWLCIQFLQ
ncbi:hypothetical protein ASG77_07300 [Arthrobacter sp. Soil762]|nr:hypothetical protein ASG77_07300 [Arthrobacter sp. Soil762]